MSPTPEVPRGRPASEDPSSTRRVAAAGPDPLRIVFMGTPEFALSCLDALLLGPDEVVGVVAQPDRPAGRGNKLTSPPTVLRARERGIPVFQPTRLKSGPFPQELVHLKPDLAVVVAYGRILPQALLDIPRLGCINVHASLLPELRGAGPIQWSVLRGYTHTGITTMFMDVGMDTGDMLRKVEIPIPETMTAGQLHDHLAEAGAQLLRETLAHLKAGTLTRTTQDHSRATSAPILKKEDGAINWGRPAKEISWHVRGMSPWPGAFTFLNGQRLVVHAGEVLPGAGEIGMVVDTSRGLDVATSEGIFRITHLQVPGGKPLPAEVWLRGHAVARGTELGAALAE